MLLTILNQTMEYSNEISSIDECFIQIHQLLNDGEYVLNHLVIDGVKVYEEHYDYISEHITEVKTIEVKVNTFKQLLDETVVEAGQYIIRSISEAKVLADEFYQGPVKETWNKLSQLLEGLQWLLQALHPIYTIRENTLPYRNSMEYSLLASELTEQFQELESALNHSDLVLIGDLLKYEIVELMLKLETLIQTTIDNEVVRHDLN